MAFTMRGLPQYGDEGPKQLGHRLKSIFGKKEEREKYQQYFKDKKAARKSLKTTGLYGGENITDASVLEGKNLGKSTVKTRREAAKAYAQDKLDGANEIAAVYTTKKVKKKDVKGGANAAAYANVNRGTGVDLDVDFDIKNTKYKKDDSGYVQNTRKETKTEPVTIEGEKKSEVFTGPDALERANKFEQEMINAGNLQVKNNDGVDMTSMGYKMKSNISQLSGAEDKAKIMQVNRNPINVTETPLTTAQGYGTGTQTDTSQDADTYTWSGKKSTAFTPDQKNDPKFNACADPNSEACKAWKKTREVPGSSSMDQKVTVNYQTPSTTIPGTTKVEEGSKVVGLGGKTGNKLSVDADVDADAKIKLPKIGKIVGDFVAKTKDKIKKKKTARNVRKGTCPPCPPCD